MLIALCNDNRIMKPCFQSQICKSYQGVALISKHSFEGGVHSAVTSLKMAFGLMERLKLVGTKTIKWTLTVAFEDHSPPLSLPIMSGGG